MGSREIEAREWDFTDNKMRTSSKRVGGSL